MKELKDIVEEVRAVALEAGAFIRQQRLSFDQGRVEKKGAHDYVSYVDKEAEKMIVAGLERIVPEAEFVTEERTSEREKGRETASCETRQSDTRLTWVVDPLDGTTNYIHGLPPYCVSIALRDDDEILVGVVYEIVCDELFSTYKGAPSWLNGEEIHVSDAKTVNEALINIGYPYDVEHWSPKLRTLIQRLYGNCASIRNYGSAAAELCYIASGRFDAYIESYLKPWDVAAGGLILKNAGGEVTDSGYGSEWQKGEEVIATNGLIHAELTDTVKSIL